MTTTSHAQVTPLEPFGAEVELDLHNPNCAEPLRELFAQHSLLIFRNQRLSMEDQRRVLGYLGPVRDHWSTVGYVSNMRKDGILGNSEVSFHSDYAYTPQPTLAISLHGLTCPYETTSTRFASGVRALDKLPAELRERVERLEGVNLFAADEKALGSRQTLDDYPEDFPRQVHPLVLTDEMTGQQALYTTQMYCAAIVGMPQDEANALLEQLHGYLYSPDNIYIHRWREGDFVIWSNQRIHHARGALDPANERTLRRVCITNADPQLYEDTIPASIKAQRVK